VNPFVEVFLGGLFAEFCFIAVAHDGDLAARVINFERVFFVHGINLTQVSGRVNH